MDWIWGLVALGLIWVIWLVNGLFSRRMEERDDELDEWSGVLDVRRETRDRLDSDPDYVDSVRDHFNDS